MFKTPLLVRRIYLKYRMIEEGNSRRQNVMNNKVFILFFLGLTLLFTACSPTGQAATTAEVIPTVLADNTIVAEGRVEPVRDAEIAFTAGGLVTEVLVEEGQPVKKGDLLIRLGGESDSNYAAAKFAVANAQKALNDLVKDSEED